LEKGGVAPAELGLVAVGKIISQEGESVGIVLDEIAPSEGAILVQADPTLVPAATGESQEFHGQGIEDFVGEHDPELSPVLPGGVGRLQVGLLTLGEACGESGSLARGVFAGSVSERGAEIRRELVRPFENVEGKGAVFRSEFKNVKNGRRAMSDPKLVQSQGEEAPEGFPDTDIGRKVSTATHPDALGITVVAVLFVVEGELHEAWKRERAFLLDERTQDLFKQRGCPGPGRGVNNWCRALGGLSWIPRFHGEREDDKPTETSFLQAERTLDLFHALCHCGLGRSQDRQGKAPAL
jgi:hypothetical protein